MYYIQYRYVNSPYTFDVGIFHNLIELNQEMKGICQEDVYITTEQIGDVSIRVNNAIIWVDEIHNKTAEKRRLYLSRFERDANIP